jgi:hypothetical protein
VTGSERPAPATLGFRVKSGWAAAALLGGTRDAPALLDLRRVELSDPAVPDSRQPFHAALETHTHAGRQESARLVAVVERFARAALDGLVSAYAAKHRLTGAGIVVGSAVDPATIANEHIRAHAEEGRLFRTVVSDAAARAGIPVFVHVEKKVHEEAARVLQQTADRVKQELIALGRGRVGPWRADEKLAALVAWLALAQSRE